MSDLDPHVVLRDHEVSSDPSSGPHKIKKSELRQIISDHEVDIESLDVDRKDHASRLNALEGSQVSGAVMYASASAGLAATSSNGYFTTPSLDDAESVLLYQNVSGSAVLKKTYPSVQAIGAGMDGLVTTVYDNKLPASFEYPTLLNLRSAGSIVKLTGNSELTRRGYRYGVTWGAGSNNFARYSSGEDLNGKYVFCAFLIQSTNPGNLTSTSAVVFSEDSSSGLHGLGAAEAGRVDVATDCHLLWRSGMVETAGDENILVGKSSGIVDTNFHCAGWTVFVSDTAFDADMVLRNILLGDQSRRELQETIKGLYEHPQNLLQYGDYFGGEAVTRASSSVVDLPDGALKDFGFERGILWASASVNEYFRHDYGDDLIGKFVMGIFLAWSPASADVPFPPAQYLDDGAGNLTMPTYLSTGTEDLGGDVHLHWVTGRVDVAGQSRYLVGSIANPDEAYATNAAVYVSDTQFDVAAVLSEYKDRLMGLKQDLLRHAGLNSELKTDVDDLKSRVGTLEGTPRDKGFAKLVLDGSNSDGYVESNLSGDTVKNTFTAFVDGGVSSTYHLFNPRDSLVNGTVVQSSGDDAAPDHFYGATIGANHGYNLGRMTAAGHGKTQADLGSVWTSNGIEYVLIAVDDDNTLYLTVRADNSAVPIGTFTHVSGAINAADIVATATVSAQWYPPFQDRTLTVVLDGEETTETIGTFYYRDQVQFIETYDVLSKSELTAWWEANAASGATTPDGQTPDVRITITYEYDKDGQLTIYRDWLFLRSVVVNDLMGIQAVRTTGATDYYVPNTVEFTHDGEQVNYALKEPANRTSTGGQVSVNFTTAEAEATGPFVDRVLALHGADHVFAMGFLPVGDADPTVRRARCSAKAMEIRGNTDKLYPRVLDKGDFSASAGDYYGAIAYRHVFAKPDGKTAAYTVRTQGSDYLFVDWHDVSGIDTLDIPTDLLGREFEVQYSKNATLLSSVLTGKVHVNVAASGSYAFLVLKVN